MGFTFQDSRVIITGGAGGIGRETSLLLLGLGARLAVWDFNKDALDAFQQECANLGYSIHCEICDVTDYPEVDRALARSVEALSGLDVLINNAGYVANGFFQEREFHFWARTLTINLEALMYLSYQSLETLEKSSDARIVNISSAAGVIGTAGLAAYSAAKWGVWGFSEALRQEIRSRGNTNPGVTTIHPSYLAKGMFEGARLKGLGALIVPPVKSHQDVAKAIVRSIRKRKNRVMLPRSVASAIFFRAILPDSWFQGFTRLLNVHSSMSGWKGQGRSID